MDNERELEKRVAMYSAMAKENKKIDVAALMAQAMEQQRRDEVDGKKKRRAYLISILLPPFGLLYAVRYYLSDKDDGKKVALYCVLFTIGGFLIGWLVGSAMFGMTPAGSLDQAKQVNVEDMMTLIQ